MGLLPRGLSHLKVTAGAYATFSRAACGLAKPRTSAAHRGRASRPAKLPHARPRSEPISSRRLRHIIPRDANPRIRIARLRRRRHSPHLHCHRIGRRHDLLLGIEIRRHCRNRIRPRCSTNRLNSRLLSNLWLCTVTRSRRGQLWLSPGRYSLLRRRRDRWQTDCRRRLRCYRRTRDRRSVRSLCHPGIRLALRIWSKLDWLRALGRRGSNRRRSGLWIYRRRQGESQRVGIRRHRDRWLIPSRDRRRSRARWPLASRQRLRHTRPRCVPRE